MAQCSCIVLSVFERHGLLPKTDCWKEKWGTGAVSVLGVGDSWTDGWQPRIRSQICRQHWHIPDQILISCQYLHASYRQSEPPLLSALYLLQGAVGVNSGDHGALLRLRIGSGSDVQTRWGRPEHSGSTVRCCFYFYLHSLLAWIHFKWPVLVCESLAKHSLPLLLPRELGWGCSTVSLLWGS